MTYFKENKLSHVSFGAFLMR